MIRTFVRTFALVVLAAAPAAGQEKVDNPRLRAALQELREARNHLKYTADPWPPGNKKQAQAAIEDAITTLRTILSVKDVDTFRGVDRGPDYYSQYKDHPKIRAALADIRDARDELRASKTGFGDLKDRALEDLDIAAGSIVLLLRSQRP